VISHLSLGVRDLGRSGDFYDAILAPLGVVRVWESETGLGYGPPGGNDKLALFEVKEDVRLAAGPRFHLAFSAPSPEAVDAFYDAAITNGGHCEGRPGIRERYGPDYYAAFIRDLDGHKLEAKSE